MQRDIDKRYTTLARNLRRSQTKAEATLWKHLARRQLAGIKFRRQQPIGSYIVDFVAFEHKLVIELDGSQHDEITIKGSDEYRTAWLEKSGYKVLRFWNNEVLENTSGVVETILQALE